MFELYQTPLDILYLVLTITVVVLLILGALVLFHVIRLLRNVSKMSETIENVVEMVNHYLMVPLRVGLMVIEKTKDHMAKGAEKEAKKAKKK